MIYMLTCESWGCQGKRWNDREEKKGKKEDNTHGALQLFCTRGQGQGLWDLPLKDLENTPQKITTKKKTKNKKQKKNPHTQKQKTSQPKTPHKS